MAMKIQEALTRTTWKDLTDEFKAAYGDDSPVYLFLSSIDDDISYMVSMDYRDLGTIIDDDVPEHLIARVAFLHMGSAFKRIFDVLTAEYNPFENFFTEGTFSKSGSIEDAKTGTEITKPSGKVEVSKKGQSSSESDGSFSVGQGSTYDTATTTPPTDISSASDLYNLSRNINKNKVKNVLVMTTAQIFLLRQQSTKTIIMSRSLSLIEKIQRNIIITKKKLTKVETPAFSQSKTLRREK